MVRARRPFHNARALLTGAARRQARNHRPTRRPPRRHNRVTPSLTLSLTSRRSHTKTYEQKRRKYGKTRNQGEAVAGSNPVSPTPKPPCTRALRVSTGMNDKGERHPSPTLSPTWGSPQPVADVADVAETQGRGRTTPSGCTPPTQKRNTRMHMRLGPNT